MKGNNGQRQRQPGWDIRHHCSTLSGEERHNAAATDALWHPHRLHASLTRALNERHYWFHRFESSIAR